MKRLLLIGATLSGFALSHPARAAQASASTEEKFKFGEYEVAACEYAAADPSRYGKCSTEAVWHCHSADGCLSAVAVPVLLGSEFREFEDTEPYGYAIPFEIDKEATQYFGGHLSTFCDYYQIDCTDLINWYSKEGEKQLQILSLHARP